METTEIIGVGVILGLYRGCIGIMENTTETTIMGYLGTELNRDHPESVDPQSLQGPQTYAQAYLSISVRLSLYYTQTLLCSSFFG